MVACPRRSCATFGWTPNLEQLGGMGVSEIMETGSWNIKVPDHSGEAAGGARRIDGPSPTLHAYKDIIIPTSTERPDT